jgi:hypothetical protein
MKNHGRLFFALAFLSLLFPMCRKQFLGLSPYDQVPLNKAIVDENSMQTAVNGMYANLRGVDFFGRSVPVYGDLMADNTYISPQNSNRYTQEYTYTYSAANFSDGRNTWAEAYNTILLANNIINANIPEDAIVDQLKGEALTIRALSYFVLLQYFAKPFLQDSSSLGSPLVLQYDPFAVPARKTVAQVYAQVEADLVQAFGLMTVAKNSSYVTKYVAESLLARVYLFEGKWSSAQSAAQDVVNNGGYSLTAPLFLVAYWANPFPTSNGVETIFEVEFDAIDNNQIDDLDAIYDQQGYGDLLCTDDLYNQYTASDARQALILPGNRAGSNVWVVNKYSNLSNPNGKDNTKIIRYAEVLLTLAEAYNRSGNDVASRQYLNQLAQTRDPAFAGYTDSLGVLLGDILNERRKELAFEGLRYWDLERLNQDVNRNNSTGNYSLGVPLTLSATDTKRIFPIPQDEINANKNVAQNPGY